MKKFLVFVLVSTFLVIIGCADKPKSLGNGLVTPSNFAEKTFTAVSDTSYNVPLMNGYSSSNLVGILPTGEKFVTLLQFYPTGATDSLNGATIDTAEIRMIVNYRMLAPAQPIQFDVFEVLQPFSEGTFTSDSLTTTTIGTTSIATKAFDDSMNYSQVVKALIDTSVARRWADDYLDTSKPNFYGFAIKALSTYGVIGFYPFNSLSATIPTLVIKFTRNGRSDSLYFTSGQDTYAGILPVPSPFADFEVRGGTGVHSKIKFDVGSLIKPLAERNPFPMVANATVTVTVDTTVSEYSGYSQDTLIAFLALPDSTDDYSNTSLFAYGLKKIDSLGQRTYEFTINAIAQSWLNNINKNEGLTIRWGAENSTREKVVFFSMSDAVKGPKLKIIYSEN